MRGIYYTATSLDGFIADPHHSLDWLFQFGDGPTSDYDAFVERIGVLAMGASTYQWLLDHLQATSAGQPAWPYSQPCFVFTHRAFEPRSDADIRFVQGAVADHHDALQHAAQGRDLWIVGGGDLVGQFHDAGMLHELVITIAPVTLGAGMPLLPRRIIKPPLQLLSAEPIGGVFVQLRYAVQQPTSVPPADAAARIVLRPASVEDVPLLRYWDEQPHVIASDPNDDWQWESELKYEPPWREQLVAELDGRAIGFLQIIDPALEESHYWGDVPPNLRAIDIWIGEADDLGRGYGTVMMRQALERCFAAPSVEAVLIDPLASNADAHRFYERFGFTFVERRRFGHDDCYVYRLDRAAWESSMKTHEEREDA